MSSDTCHTYVNVRKQFIFFLCIPLAQTHVQSSSNFVAIQTVGDGENMLRVYQNTAAHEQGPTLSKLDDGNLREMSTLVEEPK